jgi:type VI secretion system protein VasJ
MDIATYRNAVKTPIEGDSAVGCRLIDDSLFDFVEDQMMKVGSLAHSSVQWDEVERSTLKLLKEKSKDLKLVIYLLQCLHNRLSPERYIASLWLLADFITLYWEVCYPAPGKRGALPRRKFFSQIMQRFATATEKVDFNSFDEFAWSELQQATDDFEKVIGERNMQTEGVDFLLAKIKRQLKTAQQQIEMARKEEKSREEAQIADKARPVDISPVPSAMETSDDPSSKKALLNVAEFLFEQEFGQDLALRLRRYAVWSVIDELPDHNAAGETNLRPMAKERLNEYANKLKSPDQALWRKIENSLALAPYWFDGHRISYQIAKHLGKPLCCEAIWSETHKFATRLPSLVDLKFKGGEAFICEETRLWLQESPMAKGGGAASSHDWSEKRKEAFTLAKDGGVAVALSMLNDGLTSAREPRDRFYWKMLSADLLKANHLDAMANDEYRTLDKQIKKMAVTDWEPSLVELIDKLAN